jgi:hypothetical protein
MDTTSSFLRRYEDKEEFLTALEKRREEFGETSFNDEDGMEETLKEDIDSDDYPYDDESENI